MSPNGIPWLVGAVVRKPMNRELWGGSGQKAQDV